MDENINGYNKPKSNTGLIIALIVAAVVIVALVITLIAGTVHNVIWGLTFWGGTSNYTYGGASSYTASSEFSVSAADISDIGVDWIAGNITVKICDGDKIKVSEINDSDDPDDVMRYKVDHGTLIIKFRSSGRFLSTKTLGKDLIVEIPADIAAGLGLDVDTVSAGIVISELSFDDLAIDTVSGYIHATDIEASDLNIDTVSGNVKISGRITASDIDSVSGDVSFDLIANPKDIKVDTVSGRVNISLPDEPGELNIDTMSGSIKVNDANAKRSYEINNPSGSGKINIGTVSGDVKITSE